jgi:hypothetical protein
MMPGCASASPAARRNVGLGEEASFKFLVGGTYSRSDPVGGDRASRDGEADGGRVKTYRSAFLPPPGPRGA